MIRKQDQIPELGEGPALDTLWDEETHDDPRHRH